MTVDIAKKVSTDLIQENLTNLLTSTFPYKRKLTKHFDFMMICLECHPVPIYQSQACKRLQKDRRYFQEVVVELLQAGLIIRQNRSYFCIPANVVRKISEGVRNPFIKSSQGLELENKFLTFDEKYFLHAFRATYFHSLPEHIWSKYRGHGYWEAEDFPNLKRFVFDPTLTYFEGEQYQLKMYKNKFELYGPSVSIKDGDNRQYKYLTSDKAGRFMQWFVEKRMNHGKLQVKLTADRIKFHETNRTAPFQEIANKFYEEGYESIVHQHWIYDASKGLPEWEANQGYVQAGGMGFGPELVDAVLFFPQFFVEGFMPYQAQQMSTLQKNLDEMKTENESVHVELVKNLKLINENLEKNNRSMENVSIFLENLATKEDIELVQESIQKLSLELEKRKEKRVIVGLDSKCQKILNKLAEGALTRSELALFLGVSDSAPLTQIKKLLSAGEIEDEDIETGERGRPRKQYRLK